VASPGFGARGTQVGVSPFPLGVGSGEGAVPPPQKFFLNFYIKMVSCGAFWVAISYRLGACFTGIGSTVRVELKFIGDRSGILGTIITP